MVRITFRIMSWLGLVIVSVRVRSYLVTFRTSVRFRVRDAYVFMLISGSNIFGQQ